MWSHGSRKTQRAMGKGQGAQHLLTFDQVTDEERRTHGELCFENLPALLMGKRGLVCSREFLSSLQAREFLSRLQDCRLGNFFPDCRLSLSSPLSLPLSPSLF